MSIKIIRANDLISFGTNMSGKTAYVYLFTGQPDHRAISQFSELTQDEELFGIECNMMSGIVGINGFCLRQLPAWVAFNGLPLDIVYSQNEIPELIRFSRAFGLADQE